MPTYTYKCDACGNETDALHAAKDRVRLRCAKCNAEPMVWQFPCPNLSTDTTFLANRDDGFGSDNRSRMRAMAKARAAGVSTAGMVYCPGLCPKDEPLSPKAWVGGKADIKRICRENNWGSPEMGITATNHDTEPAPYRVADDLVKGEVDRIVQDNRGDVSPKERKQLTLDVAKRLKGND